MAKTSTPRESTIVRNILTALNALPHCKAIKVHGSPYLKGQADITGALGLALDGVAVGLRFEFEVKRPGEVPTPLQAAVLRQWGAVGVVAAVVTSVDEAVALLTPYLRHAAGAPGQ